MNPKQTRTQADQANPAKHSARDAEAQLDSLLQLRENRMKAKAVPKEAPPDPIEVFRRSLEREFIPVLDELASKYIGKGIVLSWDVGGILAGGREMSIEFALPPYRRKLRGTVVRDVMAFELTCHVSDAGGEVSSGPMLSLRNLDGRRFREFICEQITLMVKSILRVTRP